MPARRTATPNQSRTRKRSSAAGAKETIVSKDTAQTEAQSGTPIVAKSEATVPEDVAATVKPEAVLAPGPAEQSRLSAQAIALPVTPDLPTTLPPTDPKPKAVGAELAPAKAPAPKAETIKKAAAPKSSPRSGQKPSSKPEPTGSTVKKTSVSKTGAAPASRRQTAARDSDATQTVTQSKATEAASVAKSIPPQKLEHSMSDPSVSKATSSRKTTTSRKSAAVSLPAAKAASTKSASGLTVYKPGALPEHRPIGASPIEIAGTYGGNIKRPIGVSAISVVDSFRNPEDRPIIADTFKISRTENMSGNRPIAESTLPIYRMDSAFGSRPVAPNDIIDEDPMTLMGYLD